MKSLYFGLACVAAMVISAFSFANHTEAPLIVVVDAGHGGKDPGYEDEHHVEKALTLAWSNELVALSNSQVVYVPLRKGDEFISLRDRVNRINAIQADRVISLHLHNSEKPEWEIRYKDKDASEATKEFIDGFSLELQAHNQEVKVLPMSSYLLKNSEAPALLISIPQDAEGIEVEKAKDWAEKVNAALSEK